MTRRTEALPATMPSLMSSSRPTAAGWSSTSGTVLSPRSRRRSTRLKRHLLSRLGWPIRARPSGSESTPATSRPLTGTLPASLWQSQVAFAASPHPAQWLSAARTLARRGPRQPPVPVVGMARSERRGRSRGGVAGRSRCCGGRYRAGSAPTSDARPKGAALRRP